MKVLFFFRYTWRPNEDVFQFEPENGTTLWVSGQTTYNIVERSAKGLTTFITLNHRNTLLFVKNLTDRLVLTLPEDKHELGSTRFYIALTAVSISLVRSGLFFVQIVASVFLKILVLATSYIYRHFQFIFTISV